MKSIFLDTTYDISLGILNENWEWNQFEIFNGKKASEIIQSQIHLLLEKNNLSFSEIDKMISIAGPGFYTGLRLSEGFSDVLTFSGKKALSFYSYHIPKFLGVSKGIWGTRAYRGEYFFHQWSETEDKNILLAASELDDFSKSIQGIPFYIHSQAAIDEVMNSLFPDRIETLELIKSSPSQIFPNVNDKMESFYFRAPEDEFKANP